MHSTGPALGAKPVWDALRPGLPSPWALARGKQTAGMRVLIERVKTMQVMAP
jgi:hypothetical protein